MRLCFLAMSILLSCALPAFSQWAQLPLTGSQPRTLPDRTDIAGQSGLGPLLTAEFVDKAANARQRRALVDVHTEGVELVDPAEASNAPRLGQAHVQYRVDGNPAVTAAARRIEINSLAPGEHQIHVVLAGNDNKPMGRETTLNLHIPGSP